jgi:hypothetical protein
MEVAMDLLQVVQERELTRSEIVDRQRQIYERVLTETEHLDAANFRRASSRVLDFLFDQYDAEFFQGEIRRELNTIPVFFNFSTRMTSAGGKTAMYRLPADPERRRFEISVASTVLFNCFSDSGQREIVASGIVCHDRLEALQRVMEHEIVHLIEMLLWDVSSCAQRRFHSITYRFFHHTENKHRLITSRERAYVKFGIRPGVRVRFRFDGAEYRGVVNRVNKRATVLVEDLTGTPYSDGKRYRKYYVPLPMLEALE